MDLDTIISSLADSIIEPIKEHVGMPIIQHISYPFNCARNCKRVRDDVEQLQNKRIRVWNSVEEATRNGEEIYPNVTNWLSTTGKDIEDADLILGKEEDAKKLFGGFFPNFKALYQLSKKADEKASAIDEQLQNEQGLYPISFRTTPPPIIEHGEALQSRVEILKEIVEALKDPNLNPILVYGMGGIGKTTLAKEVLRQVVDLKLFDDVVFVAVSETPDLSRIQREIADALGLKFKADEAPERAKELHNRLNNNNTKNILIIFDDVWQELNLYAIGILSGEPSKGCRIILTSRKKNVFCIEMPTKKEFPLGLLEEDEAWRLFEKIVSIEFLANNRDFCDLAKQVVNKCGGLPLLIKIVATDLRNNKHLHAWRDMLKQLESVKGTEMYDKVHKVIESSYEKMKEEEAKSLFLLCPLFGKSNILIYDLLIFCVGLGLCKRDSIEESRDRALTLIDKLKNESLLLDGDKTGFVKIHDVVRDIAAAIASKEHCAFVGKGGIKSTDLEREDFRRISLPYCEISGLPEVLQCPEAEVFSVFGKDLSLDIPVSFFEGVKKLKVLHFAGVSSLSSLPSSLGFLTGLQTLSLDGCRRLTNVAMVANLKQLEVLSFAGSNLKELPREMEGLTRLKLLDLTGCSNLRVIPSNVLSNLHSLEELYVLSTFSGYDGWGTEGNANLVELKNLSRLTTLEIKVKDDKLFPEDWFFNGIKNYKISIGDWDWSCYYTREKTPRRILKLELNTSMGLMDRVKEFLGEIEVLYLGEVNGIEKLLYDSSMKKMNSLQCLHLKECDSLREVLPFSSGKCLPHLQVMQVDSCDNMEVVVGEGNGDQVMELTQLTSLNLAQLPNLIGICRTSGTVSFPNLTCLEIWGCKSLKYVFTTSMVKSLQQLKRLYIAGCESMEDIILVTKCEEVVVFPELKVLEIEYCSSLKNYVGKDSDRSNINESSDEYLFNELVSFPNLTSLEINKCKSLKYVFTTSMAKSLKQLKKLDIEGCDSMEEIILLTKCDEVVVFPELDSVQLQDLPNLKRFICGYDPIGCPELRKLEIYSCPRMKNFVSKNSDDEYFFNELVTLPNLEIMDIHRMGDFRYLWHQQFADKDSFSKLKSLEIGNCGELSVVFPSKVYRRFERLESLRVFCCYEVKEIYEHEGVGCEETNVLQAFVLQRVDISFLPSLKHIWSKDIDEAFSFENLQSVEVSFCPELKHVFPETIACGLLQLQKLKIANCGVELIIAELKNEGSEGKSIRTFEWPKLKSLTIRNCNKWIKIPTQDSLCFSQKVIPNVEVLELDHYSLKEITESDDHEFPSEPWKLKEVTLTNLEQDSVSFLFDFLRGIYSVEKLVLEEGSLGEIFLSDDERATGDQQQQYHLTVKHLQLYYVSKLKHIVKEDSQLNPISQCFQTLHLSRCYDMVNMAPPSSSVSFINLTNLHVSVCPKMTSLVTASTAKSMIQLMELKVENCKMMEDIIVANEDGDCTEEHNDVIIFVKLKKLELNKLPNLNSFCSANYNFSFPLLEKVSIEECNQMKKFCGGHQNYRKYDININSCRKEILIP